MMPKIERFSEEGIFCEGTREELEQWKQYKKQKALKFVEEGYSVEWYPDGNGWMDVYTPERGHACQPEIRASVKFFAEPSQFGMNKGRISKLSIQVRSVDLIAKVAGHPYETVDTLFNYDRGGDVDRLKENLQAKRLYDIVVGELG